MPHRTPTNRIRVSPLCPHVPGQATRRNRTLRFGTASPAATRSVADGHCRPEVEDAPTAWRPRSLPTSIRRLAIRGPEVDRTFELQALHHCTYVGFLDTGVVVTPVSKLRADAAFVRLVVRRGRLGDRPDGIKGAAPASASCRRASAGGRCSAASVRPANAGSPAARRQGRSRRRSVVSSSRQRALAEQHRQLSRHVHGDNAYDLATRNSRPARTASSFT